MEDLTMLTEKEATEINGGTPLFLGIFFIVGLIGGFLWTLDLN